MERQILLDQINQTISKVFPFLREEDYNRFRDGEMDEDESQYWLAMVQEFAWFINVIHDIQYKNNIDKYKHEIYEIARCFNGK